MIWVFNVTGFPRQGWIHIQAAVKGEGAAGKGGLVCSIDADRSMAEEAAGVGVGTSSQQCTDGSSLVVHSSSGSNGEHFHEQE